MEVSEALKKINKDDILELSRGNAPGLPGNYEEALQELKKIADDIPILWTLIPAANQAVMMGDVMTTIYMKTTINLLIHMYKTDKNGTIDSILNK